jgi:hypothetical protein
MFSSDVYHYCEISELYYSMPSFWIFITCDIIPITMYIINNFDWKLVIHKDDCYSALHSFLYLFPILHLLMHHVWLVVYSSQIIPNICFDQKKRKLMRLLLTRHHGTYPKRKSTTTTTVSSNHMLSQQFYKCIAW